MLSILETCKPRPDILDGTFNPEIFTASISEVLRFYKHQGTGMHPMYTDAEQFFTQTTYPTDGLKMFLQDVFARLAGDNTVPAIHRLETAFGGGKTHTLIACTHIGYKGVELEQWPVLDGDKPVGPIRAMNGASRVVAENQISRTTNGQLTINDLLPEAAMALTLYGIYGLGELPCDEALNLSRSLNIKLETKTGRYSIDDKFIGINNDSSAGRNHQRAREKDIGFHAPLIRKGAKLRLAMPEERNPKRLNNPQTEWDLLHGLIMQYRAGDIPLVRAYISKHAEGKEDILMNLLCVWTAEMGDENLKKEGNTILFGLK
ncbi:MAG: hypothetical protein U9N81_02815 [Bacillota bacterium]|nr:hypothetical protein [Bacillota bacterium]